VQVPIELLVAIATFGFVTSVTPGPNNTYLLAAGANYGTRQSLRFVNGIMLGLGSMLTAVWLGLGVVLATFPLVYQVLKYLGFAYIIYLAYKVIKSGYKPSTKEVDAPTFLKALGFQFINPKAWIVTTSFIATYVPVGDGLGAFVWSLAIFLIFTYPGAVIWAAMGQGISKILTNSKRRRVFNWAAGLLLIASMVPALFI
jgi:threonine/homoserine/homoserine lactone efflux protein